MSDLRDAAELALTALENTCPNNWTSVKENLRKALAQPKREWVGLTDDDIAQLMFKCDVIVTGPTQFDFARAIEDKLKEKNT
jgi:hypothetical protein